MKILSLILVVIGLLWPSNAYACGAEDFGEWASKSSWEQGVYVYAVGISEKHVNASDSRFEALLKADYEIRALMMVPDSEPLDLETLRTADCDMNNMVVSYRLVRANRYERRHRRSILADTEKTDSGFLSAGYGKAPVGNPAMVSISMGYRRYVNSWVAPQASLDLGIIAKGNDYGGWAGASVHGGFGTTIGLHMGGWLFVRPEVSAMYLSADTKGMFYSAGGQVGLSMITKSGAGEISVGAKRYQNGTVAPSASIGLVFW